MLNAITKDPQENLGKEQLKILWDKLNLYGFYNCDQILTVTDDIKGIPITLSALIFCIRHNKNKELNLTTDQFTYLIHNSDLFYTNIKSRTALMYALIYNESQELKLTEGQFWYSRLCD